MNIVGCIVFCCIIVATVILWKHDDDKAIEMWTRITNIEMINIGNRQSCIVDLQTEKNKACQKHFNNCEEINVGTILIYKSNDDVCGYETNRSITYLLIIMFSGMIIGGFVLGFHLSQPNPNKLNI